MPPASGDGVYRAHVHTRSCVVDTSGSIRLRVILDRNSAEVFVNDGEKTLTMTLVTPVTAEGIAFEANGGAAMDVTLHELEHH